MTVIAFVIRFIQEIMVYRAETLPEKMEIIQFTYTYIYPPFLVIALFLFFTKRYYLFYNVYAYLILELYRLSVFHPDYFSDFYFRIYFIGLAILAVLNLIIDRKEDYQYVLISPKIGYGLVALIALISLFSLSGAV